MIVDCHCHAGKGDGFRGPWDTEARIDRHLVRARAAGIDRTVVFPVFNSDYAAANARLARIVAANPRELIGFAAVNPARDAGRIGTMLRRAVEDYGFRGVKIHGLDSFPNREVCEVARRYRLPILVDVVRRVAAVEMLAEQYPDLNFIVPHLGGFSDDWTTHLQVIDQLCRFPNVYADTSGVRYWEILRRAVRRAGPRKLLFGSDGPFLHPALELYKIKLLGLPPVEEGFICGGNIMRLLRRNGQQTVNDPGLALHRAAVALPSRYASPECRRADNHHVDRHRRLRFVRGGPARRQSPEYQLPGRTEPG